MTASAMSPTTVERLAEVAVAAAAEDPAPLRPAVFTDLLAAVGAQRESAPIERALSGSSGPGVLAFRLAARMHARTQDDFLPAGRIHLGAVVLPAVLARGSGDVAPAVSAGFGVMAMVAETYGAEAQRRGLRPTGVFGPFGAAAGAAVAADLDDDSIAASLAIASTAAAGTTQAWIDGGSEWLTQVGAAARAGVEAAMLAAEGLPTARRALDGVAGFSAAMFGDEGSRRLEERLRSGGPFVPAPALKRHPVSGIAQTAVAASAEAGRGTRASPDRLVVAMHPNELDYPGTRNTGPFLSRSSSLMSIARCAALGFRDGGVGYGAIAAANSSGRRRVCSARNSRTRSLVHPARTRAPACSGARTTTAWQPF